MKNVLGIVGSKRASGNCEVLVKEISKWIPQKHHLSLLRLPDFNLSYCNGCYRCLIKEKGCILKDDLATVLQAICDADALILTAPTYFLSAHSSLKVFIERGLSFYSLADILWGKPAVGVGIAGIEGKEGSTLLDIERFFTAILAVNKGSRIVYGALPGEVVLNNKNLEVAKELGGNLFGKPEKQAGSCCRLCGGETFRYLSENRLKCMLCSNEGIWTTTDGRFDISMNAAGHEFLNNKKQALQHRDWLVGMLGRFQERKETLKSIAAEYDDGTDWIRPAGKRPVTEIC